MSDFKTQYNNPIQTTGLQIVEPTPVDDRLLIESEDTLRDLFSAPLSADKLAFITTLYDGIVILTGDSKKKYIWCESEYGLIDTSYSYPAYATNIAGQNYAGKNYNFVLFDTVAKVDITYTSSADEGLAISKKLLPYRVINNMESANVSMKSSTSGFVEIELPDKIKHLSTGLVIVLDPKPVVGEQFRITIY